MVLIEIKINYKQYRDEIMFVQLINNYVLKKEIIVFEYEALFSLTLAHLDSKKSILFPSRNKFITAIFFMVMTLETTIECIIGLTWL